MLGRAEPARDPLDERGLARAELPGEDHDVARAQEGGERGARGARVVGGRREDERDRQNSSSWSSGTRLGLALQPDELASGGGGRRRAVGSVERALDQREVLLQLAELPALLAAAVQDRSGVERRDHLAAVPRVDGAAHPCDALLRLQHVLRREVAQRDDHAGWISEICSTSQGVQVSISSSCGSRFPGGRHFNTLAM